MRPTQLNKSENLPAPCHPEDIIIPVNDDYVPSAVPEEKKDPPYLRIFEVLPKIILVLMAVAYFIWPVDLFPGLTDDVLLAIFCIVFLNKFPGWKG